MKKVIVFLLLILLCNFSTEGVLAQQQFPERPPLPVLNEDEETTVIVEVSNDNIDAVVKEVQRRIPKAQIRKRFTNLFSGFSVTISQREIPVLEEITGVKRVNKVATYKAMINDSVPFIGTDRIRGQLDESGERLTGKGIKVAVIDTGVDYTHSDLKANYRGGFDVVDCDNDPMETLSSQGMPTLHGTHVAGIIAANGQLKGVAPEAEIYAYRALGPGGQGTTEQVIEAIEKAVEDGVDIINLSLGNTVNGPDWPTSIALDKAVEKGVVAVTSNGNSGPNMWTVGSPGTSAKAISVGASLPPLKIPYLTIFGEDAEIALQPMSGAFPWKMTRDFELMDAGLGTESDFEGVEGKIALIKRGVLPFTDKAKNAQAAGARGVLIYNNTSGGFAGAIEGGIKLPVASISKEDGEWLLEKLREKKKGAQLRTVYREEEDFIAPFSSRGPVTYSWEVKPDVVAPGVAIDSTIPKDGYLGLNGTSMAAPHVAGAAALIKQAHPDWSPDQIKAALMNSAKRLEDRDGKPYYPHEQGAGRIQINEAVNMDTLVLPGAVTFGKWSLNDRREIKEATFTIENHSDETKTYYVVPPIDAPDGVQWKVPFSFTLQAGEKQEVSVIMDILPSVLKEGVHTGEILVKGGKRTIAIPYQFFIEEPDYPRVMAFSFERGDMPNQYRYEMYLPGGAEELGIALYDPDTFSFITYLDAKKDVERGLLEVTLDGKAIDEGIYKALVFAKKDGQEDTIETHIMIGDFEKLSPHDTETKYE